MKYQALAVLVILPLIVILAAQMSQVKGAQALGAQFQHIVIVAMENQNYGSVMGNPNAPFINSLAAKGSVMSSFHPYSQCASTHSAGCYQAYTAGQIIGGDGWCPQAASPCTSANNIVHQMSSTSPSLTYAAYCEDGCVRGADHFPWIGYQTTWNSCVTSFITCNGSGSGSGYGINPPGNLFNSVSTNPSGWTGIGLTGNLALMIQLNSTIPADYIWFTPDDVHNMHDNGVKSGDQYLQSLLVGSGTLSKPSGDSILGSRLFQTDVGGVLLWIWWDEYDPAPNIEYGTNILANHTSNASFDEYNALYSIDVNWDLPPIANERSTTTTDFFTQPFPLQVSNITVSPNPLTLGIPLTSAPQFNFTLKNPNPNYDGANISYVDQIGSNHVCTSSISLLNAAQSLPVECDWSPPAFSIGTFGSFVLVSGQTFSGPSETFTGIVGGTLLVNYWPAITTMIVLALILSYAWQILSRNLHH